MFFEFVGTLITIASVVLAVILMIFVVAIFDADTNRIMLVNSFRVDYRTYGEALSWRLPADSSPGRWPLFESLQDIYTQDLLGSYHWGLLLVTGFWLLCSTGVFTLYFNNELGNIISYGKPIGWFARTGLLFSLIAFIWNVGSVLFIFPITWRLNTASENVQDKKNIPMTSQTLASTLFCVVIAVIYFLREVMGRFFSPGDDASAGAVADAGAGEGVVEVAPGQPSGAKYYMSVGRRRYTLLGYEMRYGQNTPKQVSARRQYTPILCLAWSDGWVFSDGLILAGMIGATQNVLSHEIVAIYLTVIYANFSHAALVRMLMDAYVVDVPETDEDLYTQNSFRKSRSKQLMENKEKPNERELFFVRVMAFLTNFTVIFFVCGVIYLVLPRYSITDTLASPFVLAYASLTLILPMAMWLLGNLWMEFTQTALMSFKTCCLIEFLYGLIIRLAFVAILLWGVTSQLKTANTDLNAYLALWTAA